MLAWLLSLAQSPNHPLGLLFLLASSALEYVFPPFPGDTVTLLGAVLISTHGWSLVWILLVTTLGSLLGAWFDYLLGVFARRKLGGQAIEEKYPALASLLEKFARHGEAYIVINRFVPGVRAAFFYAAGLSQMRLGRVLLFAGLSSLAWNGLIIAAGVFLGASFDDLLLLAQRYTFGAWIVLGLVASVLLFRWWRKRRRAAQDEKNAKKN
jgi:membrane-associated protein